MTGSPSRDLWLRRFASAERPEAELICFPHAGGSAAVFRPLAAALAPAVDTLAVQYPGRMDRYRERPAADVAELAEAIAGVLTRDADDAGRPRVFFGHSMGAVVAYETARLLAEPPSLLVVSGRRAPHCSRPEAVHRLGAEALAAELVSLGATSPKLLSDPDVRDLILPAVRNDYRIIESYRWAEGPALRVPILALVGDRDRLTTRQEAEAWREHTGEGFELRVFPGGHFYLRELTEQVARAVVDGIRDLAPPTAA